MELKINLSDREEIAAAVPLLQMILDSTIKMPDGSVTVTNRVGDIQQTMSGPAHGLLPAMMGDDPAQVFGGAAAPTPLPPAAPSSAAAAPLPTAPEVMPATSPAVPPAPQMPAPPTAPVAVAPTPPSPAAPTSPAPGVELDSKGLPWDERIHASSKAKIADGTWRAKRNVDEALVAQVEAELRARVANAGHPFARELGEDAAKLAAMGVDPLSGQPLPSPAQVFGGAAAPAPLPIAPPVASSPPAPPAAPSEPATFEQLMQRLSPIVAGGKIPPTALNAACTANGVASAVGLQMSPQHVPLVWATLKQQYPGVVA